MRIIRVLSASPLHPYSVARVATVTALILTYDNQA